MSDEMMNMYYTRFGKLSNMVQGKQFIYQRNKCEEILKHAVFLNNHLRYFIQQIAVCNSFLHFSPISVFDRLKLDKALLLFVF